MVRFAITIFLSAFLLFLVQPLIGKYILPWFGGGSGVWTACLLFFQAMLLAGYAYAHLLVRAAPGRMQVIVHLALLGVGLAMLPIIPDAAWKPAPEDDPTWRIIVLLTVCLGGPYVMLSSTGPLLQAWFARTYPDRSPYRLYALSNAGSLLALVSYPFIFEPMMTRHAQGWMWSAGFAVFALLCGYCAFTMWNKRNPHEVSEDNNPKSKIQNPKSAHAKPQAWGGKTLDRLLWIILPALAAIMLLAITSQVSEEIAPMPFVWVLTLAVYLLSFIIAFEKPQWYYRPVWVFALVLSAWLLVAVQTLHEFTGIRTQIGLMMIVLLSCCMVCHGETYRLRPHASMLTAYYLAIATGGALGGAFVSVIAPLIFIDRYELYVGLFGSIIAMYLCLLRDPDSIWFRGARRVEWLVVIALCAGAAYLASWHNTARHARTVERWRNFYGVLALKSFSDRQYPRGEHLRLEHGLIVHGAQFTADDTVRKLPTTYYSPNSAIGRAIDLYPKKTSRRVGVVGLGSGTLATYGNPGDVYRFYEINPQIIDIANEVFTYLRDSNAEIEMVLGDARLSMENEPPQNYDILVLDAFSGDAVPVHLLTKEAFALYDRHLVPNGLLAVHVSNRYLALELVLKQVAEHFGFHMAVMPTPADRSQLVEPALWVLLTRDEPFLKLPHIAEVDTMSIAPLRDIELWTDDHASLLPVLD